MARTRKRRRLCVHEPASETSATLAGIASRPPFCGSTSENDSAPQSCGPSREWRAISDLAPGTRCVVPDTSVEQLSARLSPLYDYHARYATTTCFVLDSRGGSCRCL